MGSLFLNPRDLVMLLILKLRFHYTAMINNPAVSKFGPEAIEIYEPLNFNSCFSTKHAAAAAAGAAASALLITFKGAILDKIAPSVAHFKKRYTGLQEKPNVKCQESFPL